jgi:hypothetical protein
MDVIERLEEAMKHCKHPSETMWIKWIIAAESQSGGY